MATKQDILTAIKNLDHFLKVPALKGAKARINPNGNPFVYVGGFNMVFQLTHNSKKWAFRVWHVPMGNLSKRYLEISKFLTQIKLPYFAEFIYDEEGILVNGELIDTIRMEWLDGLLLKEFIEKNLSNSTALLLFADKFKRLCQDLRDNQISHGDLQEGNILINTNGDIKLVDYDSICTPEIEGQRELVTGLKGYQHPSRFINGQASLKADYFSELIIYLSILAIAENPKLWDKYQLKDTRYLLFSETDFEDVENTEIYRDLYNLTPEVVKLLAILIEYLKTPHYSKLVPFSNYIVPSPPPKPPSVSIPTQGNGLISSTSSYNKVHLVLNHVKVDKGKSTFIKMTTSGLDNSTKGNIDLRYDQSVVQFEDFISGHPNVKVDHSNHRNGLITIYWNAPTTLTSNNQIGSFKFKAIGKAGGHSDIRIENTTVHENGNLSNINSKNGSISINQSVIPPFFKGFLKWIVLLLFPILGYFISCQFFGYCFNSGVSGTVDNVITWYADHDGDGLRDLNETKKSTTQPSGYLSELNPIDNCPSTKGPKCTGGCLDLNGNCIADHLEVVQTVTHYFDQDGDGLGDTDGRKELPVGSNMKKWVLESGDECPNEPGPKCTNGCPDANDNCIADNMEPPREEVTLISGIKDDGIKEGGNNGLEVIKDNGKSKYFFDKDGDGLGDPDDSEKFESEKAANDNRYVKDFSDKCPTRSAKGSKDGCPECSSELKTGKPVIDKQVFVSIDESSIKPSDAISWSGPSEIKFEKDAGSTTYFRSDVVGRYDLSYSIKGTDGFNKSCSVNVCVEMTPDQMKEKLLPLLKYGMLSKGATGNFKSSANAAKEDIKRNLSKSNIMVYDEISSEINPFDTFMSADLMGSRGEIIDLEIINIRLNEDCKIDKIKIKLTRR